MSTLQTTPTDPRFAVVVNGNAKGVNRRVISSLDRALHRDDLFLSRRPEDSAGIVRTVVDRGYGTVLTGGGDGTFTLLVTQFLEEVSRQIMSELTQQKRQEVQQQLIKQLMDKYNVIIHTSKFGVTEEQDSDKD